MKDQGHGSHWETVLGQESVAGALHEIVLNSGVLRAKDVLTLLGPTSELLDSISESPVHYMTILTNDNGANELVSAYPFADEGALLKGQITDIEIWNNNEEAVVTMKFGEDREISFFATDYHINKDKYRPGRYCDVRLAAFAYKCNVEDTGRLSFRLEGDAASNLRAMIGEDEHDESPITFDMSEMTSLLSISEDYKDDYQFLSPVQYVEAFETMGVRMLIIGISVDVGLDEGDRIPLPLFVRESMFDGEDNPKPEAGESVGGALWMQGHLDRWYEGLKQSGSGCDDDSAQDTEPSRDCSLPTRMSEILNESWRIFRDTISVENGCDRDSCCRLFADIIRRQASGETGFFVRTDVFPDSARRKKVDIECGFEAEGKPLCSCAILLRSVKDNNAFTGKMFRIYKDLYFLESLLERQGEGACGYSECRFYMLTPVEAFRKTPAYKTKSEDFPEFGLNLPETAKYVRYHDARGSGERQELFFRKEYPVSWYTRTGEQPDLHFLEIDLDKVVDCIVGVYRVHDDGRLVYEHGIITEREYEDLIGGNSDDGLEAAFRLSETPFEKAELQPWTIEKGKILYASDIRVGKSASAVICDVLNDFLAINAEEMGGRTLRVRIEDGKLIKYFSKSDTYRAVGKERRGIALRSQVAYYETDTEGFY